MEKKQDDISRRPLYLYDLPPEIIDSLTLKPDAGLLQIEPLEETTTSPTPNPAPAAADNIVGSQSCSLCNLSFVTVREQRDHLKTDLHHYNIKQKLHGLNPVSETEFEKLVEDLDESISGSDTADSDEEEDDVSRKDTTLSALLKKQATLADKRNASGGADEEGSSKNPRGTGKPPLLWFNSPTLPGKTYFGVYRALFTSEELEKEGELVNAIRTRQLAPIAMPKPPKEGEAAPPSYNGRHIFMCMIGGGHFAAMVVSLAPKKSKHTTSRLNREAVVLAHKTFHRYTTRRKQGGSQSANDNAKGAAHSAGASLRRYNEQALVEDVRGLLKDWRSLIDTSDLLFIRATGVTNRRTLFGPYDGQVLRANDPRIRGFPFSTRRATQNELMRSFIELTRLKVREIEEQPTEKAPSATEPKTSTPKPQAKPKLTEEEEDRLVHTSQLQAMIRRSKLPALLAYLKAETVDPNIRFYPPEQNHHAPTCLHLAAHQNSAPLVTGLLVRGGADPTILNDEGKTAFEIAGDRATRDAFRVARSELGEKAWDWEAAKVPPPMKREEAEKRTERERLEKERIENERRKAEEERLKTEGPKVKPSAPRKGGVLGGAPLTTAQQRIEETRGMTPEMRVKLERERRARAAEERIRRMQGGS
ncbi:hypothetical protein V8F20_010020 [Naviculisporaceae sp. PSN 640]